MKFKQLKIMFKPLWYVRMFLYWFIFISLLMALAVVVNSGVSSEIAINALSQLLTGIVFSCVGIWATIKTNFARKLKLKGRRLTHLLNVLQSLDEKALNQYQKDEVAETLREIDDLGYVTFGRYIDMMKAAK